MSRRRQNAALREPESVDHEGTDARTPAAPPSGEPISPPSGAEKRASFFNVTMMLWGGPLILFIIIAVLKECEVL